MCVDNTNLYNAMQIYMKRFTWAVSHCIRCTNRQQVVALFPLFALLQCIAFVSLGMTCILSHESWLLLSS